MKKKINHLEPTQVKICGLTSLADARSAMEAGASALGFNFFPGSKRYVPWEEARDWLGELEGAPQRLGVFVDAPVDGVMAIWESGLLDAVQFHGRESSDYCRHFVREGIPFWKALPVRDRYSLEDLPDYGTDTLLLDAVSSRGDFGGSGQVFPWEIAARFVRQHPEFRVVLAGGLHPGNVSEAVELVHPWAVDVASGVESAPGVKDPAKVEAMVRAAQSP